MAIIASDYKGKWFILEDGDSDMNERPEIDIAYVTGKGLAQHVENCRYYGIPAYVGSDAELHARIKVIDDALDVAEGLQDIAA